MTTHEFTNRTLLPTYPTSKFAKGFDILLWPILLLCYFTQKRKSTDHSLSFLCFYLCNFEDSVALHLACYVFCNRHEDFLNQ